MNKFIFKILRWSGLPWVFRQLVQNNKISILLFHEIDRETAKKTFLYLKKKYNIIDLNDFINAAETNNKFILPKKALVITFDDGLIKNYEMLSVIKQYDIPVTIFLCSSIINTNRHFWYKFKNLSLPLSNLKLLNNKDRLKALAKDGFMQDKEYDEPQALSKTQITEMANYVNMQSHTKYHPCLPNCEYEEAKEEIFESKKMLEDEYKFTINALAYPNGDYSKRDIELTKEAGYKCAITVDAGFNTINTSLFRLKRLSVNDTKNLDELIVKSSGLWASLKSLLGQPQNKS